MFKGLEGFFWFKNSISLSFDGKQLWLENSSSWVSLNKFTVTIDFLHDSQHPYCNYLPRDSKVSRVVSWIEEIINLGATNPVMYLVFQG